ncbi:programmed cell death protein 2 isoform X2 [Bacillus rossius redtenbacheri]|uniref:programmed cell death protein 2 isoform X2 n=1 Tax=Bacillus rossius redtenbacheri TaxID=93214 RepID=UPI002FDEF61F
MSAEELNGPVKCVGYLNKCEPWKLHSRFFPSKVGGKPAWLDLSNLPSDINCKNCGKICVFLCQVYAPFDSHKECFHRTIFVFVCRDSECCKENCNKNFRVFRCQLPRENPYYPFDPPVEDKTWRPDVTVEKFCKVCILCGTKAPYHCGKCKTLCYCSREHQMLHWKAGHKEKCSDGSSRQDDGSARFLLPEFELQTEEDADESVDVEEGAGGDDDEDRRLSEYEQLLRRGCGGTFQGDSSVDADLLRLATPPEDRAFVAYAARVKDDPEQVLRYERGGAPLWVSDHHAAQSQDVPPCPLCAAPRSFEFQIFSVLLNHLGLDAVGRSVDWGTLAVYTCRDSCGQGPTYKEEFLCKQDFAAQPSSL